MTAGIGQYPRVENSASVRGKNMAEKRIFNVPSSDGVHNLSGVVYLPDGEIKGLFQVVHGMTEHIERYDRFLADMAEAGWLSFGYDHIGHGKTANDDSELGYIAKKRGWKTTKTGGWYCKDCLWKITPPPERPDRGSGNRLLHRQSLVA